MAATNNKKTAGLGNLIRHLFLAYLFSALLEFLFLPQQLQNLAGVEGLAQMSMLRMLLITGALTVVLWLLSLWKDFGILERWLAGYLSTRCKHHQGG